MSKKWANLLSCILVVCIMVIMMPMTVFASGTNGSTLTTDIGEKTFTVGVPVEFTFTTTAGNDAGKMVNGTTEFSNPDAIEKLEYYEVKDGNWYEFTGDFGAPSGFPMSDATSRFRVTFKEAGNYTFTSYIKEVGSEEVLCSTGAIDITVNEYAHGTLTTDMEDKTFAVGVPTEFTFTTTAGSDAGKMVNGTAIFSNPDVIEKLEYYEVKDGNWYEFTGDFGAPSGFPMSDATSRFRVTFKEAGEYTFTASMVEVGTENVLCSTEVTFTVDEYEQSTLTTDIEDKTFTVGVPTEFTFTTTAGSDAGKMVNGTAIFSNPDVIEKLEYYEVKDGNWYEFTGDFGAPSGFPMSDATSRFRVTFKEAGEYTFTASMVEVGTENVLCSTEATFTVNAQEDPGTDDPGTDTPETGDNSNIVIWTLLLFVSGAILTGIVIYGRKAKYNR